MLMLETLFILPAVSLNHTFTPTQTQHLIFKGFLI